MFYTPEELKKMSEQFNQQAKTVPFSKESKPPKVEPRPVRPAVLAPVTPRPTTQTLNPVSRPMPSRASSTITGFADPNSRGGNNGNVVDPNPPTFAEKFGQIGKHALIGVIIVTVIVVTVLAWKNHKKSKK